MNVGTQTASLEASYEFYFGKRSMPRYEYRHVPNTPLTRVFVDGKPDQEFTSLAAAKAWVEHREKLHPPIDPATGRQANYRLVTGEWVTIAED